MTLTRGRLADSAAGGWEGARNSAVIASKDYKLLNYLILIALVLIVSIMKVWILVAVLAPPFAPSKAPLGKRQAAPQTESFDFSR